MPPRARRSKSVAAKEQAIPKVTYEEPSKLLNKVLNALDLSFESDMGMFNGKLRAIPSGEALSLLKKHLENLDKSLAQIAQSDTAVVDTINSILEARKNGNIEEDSKDADGDLRMSMEPSEPTSMEVKNEREITVPEANLEPSSQTPAPEGPVEQEVNVKEETVDIDRMENDPSVKNPKSEFVTAQTLPMAAIALGLFSEDGLECTGEEFLKQKYGVASYPTDDLKSMLPGPIPDMDFSKPKPPNQVQFTTFQTSVDPYFRLFTDDDLKFLRSKHILPDKFMKENPNYDPDSTPYHIPKLGQLYTDVWFHEDDNQNIANLSPPPIQDASSILPKKSNSELNDANLESEEVSCGPLVSRLLSALLKDEDEDDDATLTGDRDVDGSPDGTPVKRHGTTTTMTFPSGKADPLDVDYVTMEERLKRELKYVGIYMNLPKDDEGKHMDDPDWIHGREDDEISAEIRELQNELKQVTKKNLKRKAALVPLVERQLAWQEYSSILEDLDKQVDQAYVKRIRVPKSKKKKGHVTNNPTQQAVQQAHQKAANSSLRSLMDKRARWIEKIGPLFGPPELMKRIPSESVFKDVDLAEEDEDENADEFGGANNNDELDEGIQNGKDE